MSAERLESQLHKVKQTIEEDKQAAMATPYALIIDGRALLYALSPRLRQLFLEVRPAATPGLGALLSPAWQQLPATWESLLDCSAWGHASTWNPVC